jgi:hypothetical protein
MIFDGVLASAGNDRDISDTRFDRFFDDVLD